MRILQISTYDISGGAARAAYRLHRGLRALEHDSRMLVRYKDTKDRFVSCVAPETRAHVSDEALYLGVAIQGHYIDSHRTAVSNTLFSLPYPGHDLSILPMVKEADIINLHWVAQYQSLITLKRLFDLGKPVVWTLHDQWAFTGGCHYAAGCEKYQTDCRACPQLAEDLFHLPEAILKDKLRLFKNARLTIVTPSRWMGACAEKSALFKDLRIEVIPNGLETDRFRPLTKAKAKKRIGLEPDTVALLFGGVSGNEKRKGFHKLMGAIRSCLKDPGFRNLVKTKKISLICFGHASDALEDVGIPVQSLGYLDSEKEIVTAYGAADLFILPSLEDNLPNTMLEAMSCGTPVVAFDVGGIPEGVKNGETGQMVPAGDERQMARAILSLISNPEQRKTMGRACRRKAEEQYRLEIQARQYADLYQELVDSCTPRVQSETKDRISGPWQISVPSKERPLSVPLEFGVGPHFNEIYDPVLFKALKEFSCHAQEQWQVSEADRATRLKNIKKLSSQLAASESDRSDRDKLIKEVSERLKRSEKGRSRLLKDVEKLTGDLQKSEADRGARLEDIKKLGEQLAASESDRSDRDKLIKEVSERLKASEKDRSRLIKDVEKLTGDLEASEADSGARLEDIKKLGAQLAVSESDRSDRDKLVKEVSERLKTSEKGRSRLLKDVEKLTGDLQKSEADRGARLEDMKKLSAQLAASESDRLARLDGIKSLGEALKTSESDRIARGELIDELSVRLETFEKDRAKLMELIEMNEEIFAGSLFGLLRHRRVAKKSMKTKARTTPFERSG